MFPFSEEIRKKLKNWERGKKFQSCKNKNGIPIIPSVIFFRKIEEILDSID